MENKTPQWLVETQNKSWEPEILISGISVTILFLLENYIYNFNAMLVQDFSFPYPIAMMQNSVSQVILNAVKFALILHLLLRGLWTGLVGLSYVFPEGVKKENLPKSVKFTDFKTPQELVMSVENVCSLLFSFIFTFIFFLGILLLMYGPLILICYFVQDQYVIENLLWVYISSFLLFVISLRTIFKNSNLRKTLENNLYNTVSYTYITNTGRTKSLLIFIGYFIVILVISFPSLKEFQFRNNRSVSTKIISENTIRNETYKFERNNDLRIQKAVISEFYTKENHTRLFISDYKTDQFHIDFANEKIKEFEICSEKKVESKIKNTDLFNIYLDDKRLEKINWYKTTDPDTDQNGLMTLIKFDSLKSGLHSIRIDKIIGNIDNDSLEIIKNWEYIPFEKL